MKISDGEGLLVNPPGASKPLHGAPANTNGFCICPEGGQAGVARTYRDRQQANSPSV
ncbi:hypothetical protein BdPhPhi1402_gp40 [Bdellovibrio phage phi1402]|uniref:hypothetical protein n=1 Tax=Bdellovibrio phage phi1402 TaxID=1035662 RepID=UPI000211A2E6|nr:hypothetical protein BdPhPhi1402_gp40 [Bdellovibrio phage phi1402]AEG42337.1 hypothetical protein [Bdellovibrio phage phi1402]